MKKKIICANILKQTEDVSGTQPSVLLGMQSSSNTYPHTRRHTSSFTWRQHQICLPSARLITQLCNTPIMSQDGGEKDWHFLHTPREISVWLPAHPASKHLFRLSFHPRVSFPPGIALLLTPLFFTTLLKFPDSFYPAICHHSAFISPPSTMKRK